MRTALLGLVLLLAQGQSAPTAVSLAGQVIDADTRRPLAGARVIAETPGSREETTTDRQGRFLLEGLAPGQYVARAEQAGYVANRAAVGVRVILTADIDGVVLPLHRSGVLSGQVVDERGTPMPGAIVQALRQGGQPGIPGLQGPSVRTNDLGEFRVASLMAGDYVVLAVPPANRAAATPLVPTYYPASVDPRGASTVSLDPGEVVFNLYVTLLSSQGYEIAGVVLDEQGQPRANALVLVVYSPSRGQTTFLTSAQSISTAADGTFRFHGIAPGVYRLTASAVPSDAPSPQAAIESVLTGLVPARVDDGRSALVEVTTQDVRGVRLLLPTAR